MKARVKKLEKKGLKEIMLPLFLDSKGDEILFQTTLLIDLGINPEDYSSVKNSSEHRKVNRGAEFIDRIEEGGRLFLKGYENQLILLK